MKTKTIILLLSLCVSLCAQDKTFVGQYIRGEIILTFDAPDSFTLQEYYSDFEGWETFHEGYDEKTHRLIAFPGRHYFQIIKKMGPRWGWKEHTAVDVPAIFRIVPNPVKDVLYLEDTSGWSGHYLYNAIGKQIMKLRPGENKIDVRPGVYWVLGQYRTKKVLIL